MCCFFKLFSSRNFQHSSIFLLKLSSLGSWDEKYFGVMFLCFASLPSPDTFSFVQECGFYRYGWVRGVGNRMGGKGKKRNRMGEVTALAQLGHRPSSPTLEFFFNAIYIQYSLLPTSKNPKINELLIKGLVLAKLASTGRQSPNSRSFLLPLPPAAPSPLLRSLSTYFY